MVIRLPGSACTSSSVWRFPTRPRGATAALNFRPAPRATRTPPASVHQRSEWCRFVWFLLTVMRYHPVQVSSGCRSAYRHHRSHTYLHCACAAYRAIWRVFELPSAIFPPAGISDTTQRDSPCAILVSPLLYTLASLRSFLAFSLCLYDILSSSLSIHRSLISTFSLFLSLSFTLYFSISLFLILIWFSWSSYCRVYCCRSAPWEIRYRRGYQNGDPLTSSPIQIYNEFLF